MSEKETDSKQPKLFTGDEEKGFTVGSGLDAKPADIDVSKVKKPKPEKESGDLGERLRQEVADKYATEDYRDR